MGCGFLWVCCGLGFLIFFFSLLLWGFVVVVFFCGFGFVFVCVLFVLVVSFGVFFLLVICCFCWWVLFFV